METIETLTELGLTFNQARIYVSLLRSKQPLAAKIISETTNITRQDVYRILPSLQKIGLIEKTITAPTMFKATPLKLGVSILVKNKISQHNELIKKADQISSENFEVHSTSGEEPDFILIPGNEAVIQKINSLTENIQESLDIVSSKRRFSRAVVAFSDSRMKALKRGAIIRVVTERLAPTNSEIRKILAAEKKAGVMTRYVSTQSPVLFLLFDNKEIMIITSAHGTLDTSALWSNNSSLIAMSKTFFECIWNSAEE
jgi:sugar-specific transcriptional regulator TrmB